MGKNTFTPNTRAQDGEGNPLSSHYNPSTGDNVLDIHDADVHNQAVNVLMHQHTATTTTLATATSGDGSVYQIDIADATGFADGDALHINTTTIETTHPVIISSTPALPTTGPATFTLDRRLDVAHEVGDIITKSITNLAAAGQVGTLANPQEYWAGPPPGVIWHVTHLTFAMGHDTAGDFALFGNLTKLVNGVQLRAKINDQYGTLTNWKTNGDINVDTGSVFFHERSTGGGTYGTSGDGPFKVRTGAVMRLDGDTEDRFELYVQDDITDLEFWNMKVQGHTEG